jgi:hypothetical protein
MLALYKLLFTLVATHRRWHCFVAAVRADEETIYDLAKADPECVKEPKLALTKFGGEHHVSLLHDWRCSFATACEFLVSFLPARRATVLTCFCPDCFGHAPWFIVDAPPDWTSLLGHFPQPYAGGLKRRQRFLMELRRHMIEEHKMKLEPFNQNAKQVCWRSQRNDGCMP